MKKRIWELDALRGFFLVLVVLFHLWYDLIYLFRVVPLTAPGLYSLMNDWGGAPFVLISGICVTFGSRPVRRGLTVLAGGLMISLVTVGMYLLQFAGKGIIIYFGILHCLGLCMLLWPLLKKLPVPVLAALGVALTAVGVYLKYHTVTVASPWLLIFGFPYPGFSSSDYVPLLPNLGYFLLGVTLGRTVYRNRQSLLPQISQRNILVRCFCWIGKNSLPIYLLHQPVLAALVAAFCSIT